MTTPASRSEIPTHTEPPRTMRAWTQRRYGGPDALACEEIAVPEPGPHEVLVRVQAAAIDRGTLHLMTGEPWMLRLAMGLRRPRQSVPGRDLAGTVVAVGDAVTRVAPGDAVVGIGRGTLAEYALAEERRLVPLPAGMDPAAAAALPISGVTALQAVDAAGIAQGMRVLITGASGGVGHLAVQIAAARGARVTGVCAGPRVEFVRSLGAERVIDRLTEDPLAEAGAYDAIIDIAGHAPLARLRRTLTRRGTLVIVGSETDARWTGGLGRSLRAPLLSPFVPQRLRMLTSREDGADVARLLELARAGGLRAHVHLTFPFERAEKALSGLTEGAVAGKVVVVGAHRLAQP